MRTADGRVIRASRPFRRAARRHRSARTTASRRAAPHIESLFRTLARAGVDRDDLFLAWDFTVASERNLSERMLAIRDDAFAQLGDTDLARPGGRRAPRPRSPISKVTEDRSTDGRSCAGSTGTVDGPVLPRPARAARRAATFNYAGGAAGASRATRRRRASPATSRGSRANGCAAARAGIYGHGLLGSRGEVNQGQLKTLSQTHGFVFCATDWIGMACTDTPRPAERSRSTLPDCDIPTIATILADITNFPTLADRVQQGMLNFLYLGRAMIHPQGLGTDAAFQVGRQRPCSTPRACTTTATARAASSAAR